MEFRITGLSPEPFRHLFGLSDEELLHHNARRMIADSKPGYPDRIELRDVEPGETVLLVNYVHQPAETPFRSSHAVFLREGAAQAYDKIGEVPEVFRSRLISLRAFDGDGMMVDADVADGDAIEPAIARMLEMPEVAYLHAHFAKRGCFAARIDRA